MYYKIEFQKLYLHSIQKLDKATDFLVYFFWVLVNAHSYKDVSFRESCLKVNLFLLLSWCWISSLILDGGCLVMLFFKLGMVVHTLPIKPDWRDWGRRMAASLKPGYTTQWVQGFILAIIIAIWLQIWF